MPNKKYRQGANYEYKIMRELRAEGWTCTRSAGSHGAFDIIAIRECPTRSEFMGDTEAAIAELIGEIKLIQAKTGKSKKHAIEKVIMTDIAKRFNGLYRVEVEVI